MKLRLRTMLIISCRENPGRYYLRWSGKYGGSVLETLADPGTAPWMQVEGNFPIGDVEFLPVNQTL